MNLQCLFLFKVGKMGQYTFDFYKVDKGFRHPSCKRCENPEQQGKLDRYHKSNLALKGKNLIAF